MATELGVAYLSVVTETGDLARSVRKQFDALDADAGRFGRALGQKLAAGLKIGTKAAAAAVVGLGAIVAGMAAKGGLDRALKIDAAQAKLRGLGHDTGAVQAIMANALAAVKGTAFGLGEAATTAAGAVAAGIKPGEDLERVLKSVANSAAAAGVPMADMGAIYNKVASQGKAQNDVLQQVAERGIPIYQALGEQMGMTAEEVFDAASKGKIGFSDFEAAMTRASGNVAKEMGTTLPGQLDNFKAALARLGESVISKVLPSIGAGLAWLTTAADDLGPAAKRIGEALGNAFAAFGVWLQTKMLPAIQEAAAWVTGVFIPALAEMAHWFQENTNWIGPLTAALAGGAIAWYGYAAAIAAVKLVTGGFSTIAGTLIGAVQALWATLAANPIGVIIALVAAAAAGLTWFFTQTDEGRALWEQIWGGIQAVTAAVVEWFTGTVGPALAAAWDGIMAAAQAVADWWQTSLAPALTGVWDGVMAVVAAVVAWWQTNVAPAFAAAWAGVQAAAQPVITWFAEHVGPVFQALGELIKAIVDYWIMPAFNGFMELLGNLWNVANTVWGAMQELWRLYADAVTAIWNGVIQPILTLLGERLQAAWMGLQIAYDTVVKPVFAAIGELFTWLWATVAQPIINFILGAWNVLWAGIQAVWGGVGNVVMTSIGVAFQVMGAIVDGAMKALWAVISTVWDAIRIVIETALAAITAIIQLATGLIKGDWEAVWNAILAYFGAIWGGITQLANTLVGGFLAYLQGVWTAIAGSWNALWDGVKKLGSDAWNWLAATSQAVFTGIMNTLKGIWDAVAAFWTGLWEGLKNTGKAAWDWIVSTVTGVFDGMKNSVTSTFSAMAEAVGAAWNKIKSFVASPINAVIDFINAGIIGSYNWVADKIKIVPKIEGAVPKVAFARGGILPGKSSYRDGDDQLAWMRRGEGVTVSEALRDPYERRRLLALNKAALAGMSPARFRETFDRGIPAHAGGGIISFRGHRFTQQFAANIMAAEKLAGAAMQITQGGWRPRTSYSGTSHAGDALDITGNYRRFILPLRRVGIPTWDRAGKGNWVAHAHGVPLPGAGTAAGSAVWQAQDYLRGGDGLGGRDNGPRVSADSIASSASAEAIERGGDRSWWDDLAQWAGDTWDGIKRWFDEVWTKITAPLNSLKEAVTGAGPFGDMVKGLGDKLAKDLGNWIKGKLGLPKDEGYRRGTRHAQPGWAWVGEDGPELVNFRGGEQVIPTDMSHALTRGGMTVYLSMPKDAFESVERLFEFMSDLPGQVRRMGGVMV